MSGRSDFVTIEAGGLQLDVWMEYRVESDMLTPADAFEFVLGVGGKGNASLRDYARVREACAPGTEVQLYIGADVTGHARRRALQLTGRIDDRERDTSKTTGTVLKIKGRDRAAYLVDSAAPVGLLRSLGDEATFFDLVRAAVAPWNIEVISDASAARNVLTGAQGFTSAERLEVEQAVAQGISRRLISQQIVRRAARERRPVADVVGATPSDVARGRSANGMTPSDVERQRVNEASAQPGETIWGYLERHAERLGVMMWMSPRGELIIGSPAYSQPPLYRFVMRAESDPADPNNYQEGRRVESVADRLSKVTVYGRAHGHDVTRSAIRAVAKDESLPFVRQRIEHRQDCTSAEAAARAAKRILREGIAGADLIDISADDHGQGHYLYAANTTCDYVNEYDDVNDRRFVLSRTFERSIGSGTRTQLHLVPLNSLTL